MYAFLFEIPYKSCHIYPISANQSVHMYPIVLFNVPFTFLSPIHSNVHDLRSHLMLVIPIYVPILFHAFSQFINVVGFRYVCMFMLIPTLPYAVNMIWFLLLTIYMPVCAHLCLPSVVHAVPVCAYNSLDHIYGLGPFLLSMHLFMSLARHLI